MAQTVKRLSTMWETQVQALGWEDPLEKEMAIHSNTIAWKSGFPYFLQFKSEIRVHGLSHSQLPVLFLLTAYSFSIFGCKEYNQSDFSVDHLVMSMCRVRFCGSAGKESVCNVRDLGSIPGLIRTPLEKKGYPFWYSGLENSMDHTVHGIFQARTLEWVAFLFSRGSSQPRD